MRIINTLELEFKPDPKDITSDQSHSMFVEFRHGEVRFLGEIDTWYECGEKELKEMIKLITDYMKRYRSCQSV